MSTETRPPNWRGLRLFNVYRLIISALLLAYHVLLAKEEGLLAPRIDEFTALTLAYGAAAIVFLVVDELRRGGYDTRLQIGLALDLVFLGLLGYANGAADDNLHILMVVSVAFASLLLGGREALAFAALGSVYLLTLAIWEGQNAGNFSSLITHAGLQGMALFAVAILASTLARRLEVSERLAAQRGIDLANETLLNRLILERSREGVLIVDESDTVRHANRAALDLLQRKPEDGPGRALREINPAISEALRAWREQPDESLALARIDEPDRLHIRIVPLTNDPRGPVSLFIEDDAHLMSQIEQEKLAALGRLSASIAHEIRNPLGAISQAGQLLEQTASLAEDRRLLGIIRAHVERINRLVENVLTTSRRKKSDPILLDLSDWVQVFVEHYRNHFNSANVHIDVHTVPGLKVRADPMHLEQILTILLDNAIQHGKPEQGEARITVLTHPLGPQKRPCLSVQDNGPGIPAESLERLFEPFFSTHSEGNGLGLFIARELAEANRLSLQYHALDEGGSCFRLTFPRPSITHATP